VGYNFSILAGLAEFVKLNSCAKTVQCLLGALDGHFLC